MRIALALMFVLTRSLAGQMPPVPAALAWIDGVPICHSGADDQSEHHSGTMPDCAACVLCHAIGIAAVVPEAADAGSVTWRMVPASYRAVVARGPPADPFRPSRFPTGPPTLA